MKNFFYIYKYDIQWYTYQHCLTSKEHSFPTPAQGSSRIIWTEVPDTKTDSKLETRIGPAMGNHVSVAFSKVISTKKKSGLKNLSCFTVSWFFGVFMGYDIYIYIYIVLIRANDSWSAPSSNMKKNRPCNCKSRPCQQEKNTSRDFPWRCLIGGIPEKLN